MLGPPDRAGEDLVCVGDPSGVVAVVVVGGIPGGAVGFRLEIIRVPGLGNGWGLYDLESIPLTVVWMLAVVNGYNLVDGIDGLQSV